MDIKKLKRNASKIHTYLKRMKDGSTIAVKPVEIMIPKRFTETNLARIGATVEFIAIYAIIADGYYGVDVTAATVTSIPSSTRTVVIDEVPYLVFSYDAGAVVFTDNQVVKMDKTVYYMQAAIVDTGRYPWYMDDGDRFGMFSSAIDFAGARLGTDHAILEMIASECTRNSKNLNERYRYTVNKGLKAEEVVIGMRNIQYTAETTSAKLGGSWADLGITGSILKENDSAVGLEEILLM